MWGQVKITKKMELNLRIIPTRVGTRVYPNVKTETFGDHPHACGDKLIQAMLIKVLKGSSPRVWGQVVPKLCGKLCDGIIPTRVGTSISFHSCDFECQDHPHACGDKGFDNRQ